jgi:hypothetical protein
MPRIGQFHTEDTKERIRQTLIANHPTRGKEKVAGEWVPRKPRNPRGFCSEETRKKRAEAGKLRRGVLHPAYGRKVSEETKAKISIHP